MNKPNVFDVIKLMKKKEDAVAALNEVDEQIAAIAALHGFGRIDYDLEEFLGGIPESFRKEYGEVLDNGRYLKLEITDNVQALKDGEIVWKSVAVKPISFSTQSLKRCPASLK